MAASPTTSGSELTSEVTTGVPAGHGLERRQSEAFVERGEDEGGGGFEEIAQRVEGHEAEEAHGVLDAALDHGAAHGGMPRDLVADDDEVQILVSGIGDARPSRATAKASTRRGIFFCVRMLPA